MLHVPILPAPTVKLDIQRLLKSTPSPPSLTPNSQPSRPYTTSYPSFTPVPSTSAVPPAPSPAPPALHPAPSQERHLARAQVPQVRRAQETQPSPFSSAGPYLVAAQRDVSPDSGPSVPSTTASTGSPGSSAVALGKRPAPDEQHPSATPAKKQSKWTSAENATIISLRGQGMKWEDVSRRLPGRSPTSCRLHYQNYLERRMSWDDEKKNKLARLYERMKPELWGPLAAELGVPWRAAEAMHWALGQKDMAQRAGVEPFSMSEATAQLFPTTTQLHGHSPLSFGQVPGVAFVPSASFPQSAYGTGATASSTPLPSPALYGPRDPSTDPTGMSGRLSPHHHPLSQQYFPYTNASSMAAYRRPSDPGLGSYEFTHMGSQAPSSAPSSIAGSTSRSEAISERLPALGSATGKLQQSSGASVAEASTLPSLAEIVGGTPAYAGFVGGPPIERKPSESRKPEGSAENMSAGQLREAEQRNEERQDNGRLGNGHSEDTPRKAS